MNVKEIMTSEITSVCADDSVKDAANTMKRLNVGVLPVVESNQLVGTVTDRDIIIRCVAERDDLSSCRVGDAMSGGAVTCRGETTIQGAAELMERHKIRRLFVVDDGNKCIGVVSLGDLAMQSSDEKLAGEVLHEVSVPVQTQ